MGVSDSNSIKQEGDSVEPDVIFITGYAKLPKGITATELYHVIAVGLKVDRNTGVIVEADCSLVTEVARDFFRDLVIGKSLNFYDDIHLLFKRKYYGSAKKALISALKTCCEKYRQIVELGIEE